MNYLSIDYLIVYAFLAITLFIGFRAGRGIKDIREYAIADRNFGTGALVLTYLATNIAGASVLNGTAYMFSQGIIVILALSGLIIAFLIKAYFIAPKASYFKDCLTMGDLMGTLYDQKSRVLAGILGSLTAISLAGMELILLGFISESLLGIKAEWAIVVGGMLLAAYSAYGGIKSVTATDVFQFLVLIIVFPSIAYIVLNQAGGIKEVFNQVPSNRFKVFTHENFSLYLTLFLMWSIFPVGMMDPAIIQRLLMGRDGRQLRNQYLVIAAFDPAFQLMLLFISFATLALYPNIEAQQVIPHIIQNLLPVGMKGLAMTSLLAISITSIDSYLHAAGLTFTHDVIKPLREKKRTINELRWVRYATVAISLGAITIALTTTDTFALLLNSLAFTGPLLMFPLVSGIMGLKTDRRSFYVATVATLVAFALAKLLLPPAQSHLTTLLSVVANGISFLSMHVIQNKGFAIVNRSEGEEVLWRPRKKRLLSSLSSMLPTPRRIIRYSQDKVAKYGAPYVLFGVFFTINFIAPYFMWAQTLPQYNNFMLTLRLIGGFLCGLLLVKEKWPQWLLPYMPVFWHLTILYCLPFTSTMMFLLTGASTEWLVNIAIIIILLFILVDWVSALILGVLGIGLGFLVYMQFVGDLKLPLGFTTKYLLLYQGLFGVLIGLIFARRKQLAFNRLASQRDYFKTAQQGISRRLAEAINYREEFLKELTSEELAIFDEVTAEYLKQAVYRMTDYLRLDVTQVELDQLVEDAIAAFELQEIKPLPTVLPRRHMLQETIQADPAKLKELLVNSLVYVQKHNPENYLVRINLDEGTLGHKITHMEGYTRKLKAVRITVSTEIELPPKQDIYMIEPAKASTWTPRDQAELPLVENARIVDAHYGYIDVSQPTTHVYVLPINLREIRGKVMELLRQPVAEDPEEVKHPLAIQLEQELLAKLQGTEVDLGVIHKALKVIKKYHGGVRRKSGEPFFTHPMNVALILLDYSKDQDAVVAALLHDTVEDTSLSMVHIKAMFGETVAFLVNKVTNLEDDIRRVNLKDYENIQRLINYEDPRAALVKLSDRLHNMRTISGHPSIAKQKRIADETLTFFVPLAKNLALKPMAEELNRLSLEVLEKEG